MIEIKQILGYLNNCSKKQSKRNHNQISKDQNKKGVTGLFANTYLILKENRTLSCRDFRWQP